MNIVSTLGIDLAKNVFSVHGVDAEGAVVVRSSVSRARGPTRSEGARIRARDQGPRSHQRALARRAQTRQGVGPITASALVATVGNGHDFKNGRQFAAWLGLVPRQYSTGGKTRLGHITKRGDPYLRTLLVMGARAVLQRAARLTDPLSRWALAVQERRGYHRACIAIAAKNARVAWALLAKEPVAA
jgi:transposase